MDQYIKSRRPLHRTAEAIRRGHITIGFIGGSITEPADGKRWSDKIADWFVASYPGVTVDVENAAKGAAGTLSAILRVDTDILDCGCDLVFIETAVNDGPDSWGPCREGMLRKLLKDGRCDVVLTYTYAQSMYDAFLKGELPDSITDWEKLAGHYRISSVFMSRYTFDLVMKGFLRWEEWLPDGLHPEHAGSRLYAEPVCRLLKEQIETAQAEDIPMPAPLYPDHWEETYLFPLRKVERRGAWRMIRQRRIPSVTYELYTASMTSSLAFRFEGRGLIIHTIVNAIHAGYRLRIDGGEWITVNEPLPEWGLTATDWVKQDLPAAGLPQGEHLAEIEPVFPANGRATNFELCMIGVIR